MSEARRLISPSRRRFAALASLALAALVATPAVAIEMGDPNMSADAAYCRDLTEKFHRALASVGTDAQTSEARQNGERGAKLCRFERYREGIALLERTLTVLSVR